MDDSCGECRCWVAAYECFFAVAGVASGVGDDVGKTKLEGEGDGLEVGVGVELFTSNANGDTEWAPASVGTTAGVVESKREGGGRED
jgi:hypothetical protein